MSEMKNLINEALNENVDLTEREYLEKILEADKATEGHGMTEKASVKESTRHKRIQSNFYGISLNFLSTLLNEMTNLSALLMQQNAMLFEICKEKGIDVNRIFKSE